MNLGEIQNKLYKSWNRQKESKYTNNDLRENIESSRNILFHIDRLNIKIESSGSTKETNKWVNKFTISFSSIQTNRCYGEKCHGYKAQNRMTFGLWLTFVVSPQVNHHRNKYKQIEKKTNQKWNIHSSSHDFNEPKLKNSNKIEYCSQSIKYLKVKVSFKNGSSYLQRIPRKLHEK